MAVKDESLRYSLDHFTEVQEITTLIESIGSICHDDILLEAAEERFIGKLAEFVFFFSPVWQSIYSVKMLPLRSTVTVA